MLVEFSVANFRSFKEMQTLSFEAAPIKSKYPELDTNNVFQATEKLKLLKTIGMYGANGSGKSNFAMAFFYFRYIIEQSFGNEDFLKKFELNLKNVHSQNPIFFQIIFILEAKKYRYGFSILDGKIESEWLFGESNKKETYYFTRSFQEFKINEKWFPETKEQIKNTSDTNLFLNICAFNNKIVAKNINHYFTHNLVTVGETINKGFTAKRLEEILRNENDKLLLLQLMSVADFNIYNVYQDNNQQENSIITEPSNRPSVVIQRNLNIDNKGTTLVNFDLEKDESSGTQKYLEYVCLIIKVINESSVLFLDEFDAKLHPLLTKKIIEFFNSPKTNPKNAQLFFVTHDTNLLDSKLLRRDQIYFAEKNKNGESKIYSLTDFKGVRNDASFEKDYIDGVYGAIPYLGDFNKLFEE